MQALAPIPSSKELSRFSYKESLNAFYVKMPTFWESITKIMNFSGIAYMHAFKSFRT